LAALIILSQGSIGIQLEIDDLTRAERHGDLAFVGGCSNDGPMLWSRPLIDSAISEDVTDSSRVDLEK
jgi:hypothetical protein